MTQLWDFPTAFSHWGREEHAAIARVIASGRFTMGEECEALEEEFAAYHQRKFGIAVNSGSSANLIAVEALLHKRDNYLCHRDTAIVPALAWPTTYAPLMQRDFDLVLADCGRSWNADPADAYDCDLFVMVPILGNPMLGPDVPPSAMRPRFTLEDCCESVGAEIGGRLAGTFGDPATFSFYWSHQISAIEGGMILTDDAETARLCRLLRNHGWTKGIDKPWSVEEEYRFEVAGYNVRPLELHCAIAREQLRKLKIGREQRWRNWCMFWEMAPKPLQFQAFSDIVQPNPFGIAFLLPTSEIRERVANALRAASIDCRPIAGGSFRLQPYGKFWADQQTPQADEIHRRGLMIGCPPFAIDALLERAAKTITNAL